MKLTSGSMGCPSIYACIQFERIRTSAFGAEGYPLLIRCLPSVCCHRGLFLSAYPYPRSSARRPYRTGMWVIVIDKSSHSYRRRISAADRRPADNYPGDDELPWPSILSLTSPLLPSRSSRHLSTCLSVSMIHLTMTPIVSSSTRVWQCSTPMQLFPCCESYLCQQS
jgi:hypothetical protein